LGVGVVMTLVLAACAPDEEPSAEPEPPAVTEEAAPEAEPPEESPPEGEPAAEEPPPEEEAAPAADPDLSVEVVLTEVAQMTSPVAGTVGPDGTFYLAERGGTVHPLTDQGLGDPVIDVSDQTTTDSERGLLGVAVSADGTEFYASYTDPGGANVLAAFPIADGTIDGDDERIVMTIDQPRGNHNGGDVQVGPDGMVYWGIGDGGGAGDPQEAGQDLTTPLGAMLRIDPQGGDPYDVPSDNPFLDEEGAAPEIWAYGLRNPWRFSFDRETGELYIADVGQNEREEVNVVPHDLAGANYGWNLMEGTMEFAGSEPDDHVPPVFEYDTGARCAITGGFVYRGQAIPELLGAYLYSDYCDGDIRAIVVQDGEVIDEDNLAVNGGQVVSFVQDADGELYVLDLGGTVSRIDPA
jgi:glucose/arabinose dehydrogenase